MPSNTCWRGHIAAKRPSTDLGEEKARVVAFCRAQACTRTTAVAVLQLVVGGTRIDTQHAQRAEWTRCRHAVVGKEPDSRMVNPCNLTLPAAPFAQRPCKSLWRLSRSDKGRPCRGIAEGTDDENGNLEHRKRTTSGGRHRHQCKQEWGDRELGTHHSSSCGFQAGQNRIPLGI